MRNPDTPHSTAIMDAGWKRTPVGRARASGRHQERPPIPTTRRSTMLATRSVPSSLGTTRQATHPHRTRVAYRCVASSHRIRRRFTIGSSGFDRRQFQLAMPRPWPRAHRTMQTLTRDARTPRRGIRRRRILQAIRAVAQERPTPAKHPYTRPGGRPSCDSGHAKREWLVATPFRVGERGFEPPTSASRTLRANRAAPLPATDERIARALASAQPSDDRSPRMTTPPHAAPDRHRLRPPHTPETYGQPGFPTETPAWLSPGITLFHNSRV